MITQIEDAKITGVTTSGAILLDAAGNSYRIELSQNCLLKLKSMIDLAISRQDLSKRFKSKADL